MKLFDLLPEERQGVKKFVAWHAGYAFYVCLFFLILFRFNLFKSHWFLEEFWIINLWAPLHTLAFIALSPYRRDWVKAVGNMYRALDGDMIFCIMALVVFGVGFYFYSLIIWLAGGLFPSIIFN